MNKFEKLYNALKSDYEHKDQTFVDDLKILPVVIHSEYKNYHDAFEHMTAQGVRHLGWINDGITIPDYDWKNVYHNLSGSSCLYVDQIRRVSYSVDMGD